MNRVEFSLPDDGLREIRGMIWLEDGVLQIKIVNKLMGLGDGDVDVFKVEPTALEDFAIKRGFFQDKLILKPYRVELLDLIPGKHMSSVKLKVWRKHRRELEALEEEFWDVRVS